MESEGYCVTVQAGPHTRRDCPVTFLLPESLRAGRWELEQTSGLNLPLQVSADGAAVFMLPELAAGETIRLPLLPARQRRDEEPFPVTIADDRRSLSIAVSGRPLTCYHYADVPARPYFYPLLTADGREVTRAFPMRAHVPAESSDHPHHRSLWIAFGDVSGVDNWSEEPGHGSTRHDAVLDVSCGDVFGRFTTRSAWIAPQGASHA